MKKMIFIVIIPVCILLGCIIYFQMLFLDSEFQLKTVKGDAKYLNSVTFTTTLKNGNNNLMRFTLDNAKTSYAMSRTVSNEDYPTYDNLTIRANTILDYDKDESNYFGKVEEKEIDASYDHGECKETRVYRKVKQGTKSFGLYIYSDGNRKIYSDNVRENPSFKFLSNQNVFIQEERYTSCDVNQSSVTSESIVTEDEDEEILYHEYNDYSSAYYSDDTSYFLPYKSKQDIGELNIYQIMLKPRDHSNVIGADEYVIKVKPIVKLNENRNYQTIKVLKERKELLLFSVDDTYLYVTKYDFQGNVIKELPISLKDVHLDNKTGKFMTNEELYDNKQYVCWELYGYLNVIDVENMEFVSIVASQTKNMKYTDLYYQDGYLYGTGMRENMINKIVVYHQQELCYEGEWITQDIVHQTKENAVDTVNIQPFEMIKVVR